MKKHECPMFPAGTYYVFGQTPGAEVVFEKDDDYNLFLSLFTEVVHPICIPLSYSILPDEYHFVLRVMKEDRLPVNCDTRKQYSEFISKQFNRFFTSFGKRINACKSRKGNVFIKPFQRQEMIEESDLTELIRKLPLLPVERGYVKHPSCWEFSSYFPISNLCAGIVDWNEISYAFGSLDDFQRYYDEKIGFTFDSERGRWHKAA